MTAWLATVPMPAVPYLPRPLPAETIEGHLATITTWPIPYVFVLAVGEGFFGPVDPGREHRWDEVRRRLARAAAVPTTATIPKLGLVASTMDEVLFRTRMGRGLGWHPGAPGGGLLAFGAAALREGTVPSLAAGDPGFQAWTVRTPAGQRHIAFRLTPTGAPGLTLTICTTNPKEI